MGKKSHSKDQKKKPTKKEIKQQNHLRLIQGKKGASPPSESNDIQYKKSA